MSENKRDRLAEFNRGNILGAAGALFEANGMEQTTMDDIAKKADCSKSTIYVYFRSKEDIYYNIVRESMVMLKNRFQSVIAAHADFEAIYYAICGELTEFQREYPLYFDSILEEISVDETDFERCPVMRDIYETGEEINAVISAMLRQGMESGYLRASLKPIPTIFTLWAGLGGVIKMAQAKEKYFRDKLGMSRQEYLDYSFGMLLRSLKGGN